MRKSTSRIKPPLRLIFLLGVLLVLALVARFARRPAPARAAEAKAERDARAVVALIERENQADRTVWAKAIDAQRHEDVFLRFWDSVNRATNALAALGALPFQQLHAAGRTNVAELAFGIRETVLSSVQREASLSVADWFSLLARWQTDGWRVERTSWRQVAFAPAEGAVPARSVLAVAVMAANDGQALRLGGRGELEIEWQSSAPTNVPPAIGAIRIRRLEFLSRHGAPLFRKWVTEEVSPAPGTFSNDPLLVHDLDGDGRSELILVGANRVWWNQPPFPEARGSHDGLDSLAQWRSEPLASLPESQIYAAVLAPLTKDGRDELVCVVGGGVLRFRPDARGRFPGEGEPLWEAPEKLRHPQVLTMGDIDGDGDLDLFLGQYKLPYHGGQMPTPYYDANDGFPSYLLRNDGGTNLTDITASSGLAAKAHRRVYSSSLVDLDGDGDLDLVLVCDFAGVDLLLNDGHGHFADATAQLGDQRHLAGMAHALGDFNGDGRLDLLAIGMDSPTAATLDSLRLGRDGFPEHTRLRSAITFGNRLYFGDGQGGFRPAGIAREMAKTGWTWGVTAFDLENNGTADFYFANGHETFASVKDYERQFWLHDIYVASSTNDPVLQYYFRTVSTRRREDQASFGGWQDNVLLLNAAKSSSLDSGGPDRGNTAPPAFYDIAYLAGVSVSADSRNVAAEDLDGDGRMDLVVLTFELWPVPRQRLLVFHNEVEAIGHWIGFRFPSELPGRPLIGARVVVETASGPQTRWLVTGDGYRTQHSAAAHFGLGRETAVRRAAVIWPDGSSKDLGQPAVDHWHPVR
jgi:hypothetical protein